MKLSLIIPCYNEACNLKLLIERCATLKNMKDIEVLLVDNGSTDDTPECIAELTSYHNHIRFIRVDVNNGYGFGILAGLEAAKGNILAWTHADMQTDPIDIIAGLKHFATHGEEVFVKGRRYGRPVMDVFFTIGMTVFETLLLRRILIDINAQPTMFSRTFYMSWEDPPHDFSLDLFAYYMAKQKKLRICRIPVLFGERAYGVSHWNINWKSKVKFIRRTLEYSIELKKRFR
jgi:glycosyltransferase involved in cell wall biosynthesis